MFNYLYSAFPILLPLTCCIAAEWLFVCRLKREKRPVDFFELGVFYSAVVLLYAIFPAVEYLTGGLSFSVLGEYRLFRADPSPAQLGPIFWYYAGYLACFVFAYGRFRGQKVGAQQPVVGLDRRLVWILGGAYACTYIFFAVLKSMWNLNTPESYGETYLLYDGLPPVLQSMANHMVGVALLLQLLLMAFLMLDYARYKRWIYCWLALDVGGIAIFGVGSRTGLMVLLLSFLITYNRFVKKFSMRTLATVGMALFVVFMGLGVVRALSSSADNPAFSLMGSGNEFDNLLANAYDLHDLKAAGDTADIFPQFYFADFTRVLPEGVFPSGHIDPSRWYVQNFYPAYADQGGGFAFGVIPECIVGLGWFDVIWRGLLVGWAFGMIHRFYVDGPNTLWRYAFYLWATVFSFQTFRVTTFNLVPRAVSMFLIWWFAKTLLGLLQSSAQMPAVSPSANS